MILKFRYSTHTINQIIIIQSLLNTIFLLDTDIKKENNNVIIQNDSIIRKLNWKKKNLQTIFSIFDLHWQKKKKIKHKKYSE